MIFLVSCSCINQWQSLRFVELLVSAFVKLLFAVPGYLAFMSTRWACGGFCYTSMWDRVSFCRMTHFDGAAALKLSSWYVGNAEVSLNYQLLSYFALFQCAALALEVGAFGYCDAARLGRRRWSPKSFVSSVQMKHELVLRQVHKQGHMSRKTPEVKVGLYSLWPQSHTSIWKQLPACRQSKLVPDKWRPVCWGLDLLYCTTDKQLCSCPLRTKTLEKIMTGVWSSLTLGILLSFINRRVFKNSGNSGHMTHLLSGTWWLFRSLLNAHFAALSWLSCHL